MTYVKFLVDNGSAYFSLGDGNDNTDRACGSILSLLLFSLILNCAIVVTILRSSLRSHIYNIFLLSLSLTLLLDAGLNLVMASIIKASWTDLHRQLGSENLCVFCALNSASMQYPVILEIYFLVLLGAHRSIVLSTAGKPSNDFHSKDQDFKVIRRLNGFSWLLAPVVLLPLALRFISSGYFQDRYSCSPTNVTENTTSAVLSSLIFLLGYCLPWTAILHYWISLLLRLFRERRRLQTLELVALQRAAAQSSPIRGLGSPLGFSVPYWSQIWGSGDTIAGEGFRYFLLTGLLTIFHIILVLPHTLYVLVTQFYTSYYIPRNQKLFELTYQLPAPLRPISTSWLDNTLLWFRFLYTMVVPCLVLIIHRDLRTQLLTLFNCCRSNNHIHSTGSLSSYLFTRKPPKSKRKSKLVTLDDVKTPVLFATNEGIFLRTAAAPYASFNSFRVSFPSKAAMIEPRFVSVFADISTKELVQKPGVRVLRSPILSAKRLKNEVENLEDCETVRTKKAGKSVRFSQRVSEIPLNDSGVSSSESAESAVVTVRPAGELRVFDRNSIQPEKRRRSDPFVIPTSQPAEGGNRLHRRTLEQMLSTSLSSSSSSLLLSLSQRMRNRHS